MKTIFHMFGPYGTEIELAIEEIEEKEAVGASIVFEDYIVKVNP